MSFNVTRYCMVTSSCIDKPPIMAEVDCGTIWYVGLFLKLSKPPKTQPDIPETNRSARVLRKWCLRSDSETGRHVTAKDGTRDEAACATAQNGPTQVPGTDCHDRGPEPSQCHTQKFPPNLARGLSNPSLCQPCTRRYQRTRNRQPAAFDFPASFLRFSSQRSITITRPSPYDFPRRPASTMDAPEEPQTPFSAVTTQTTKLQRVRCDKEGPVVSHTCPLSLTYLPTP
jgi:hypothetical protein